MKKVLIAIGMIFCMITPALAGGDLKVSGTVEVQYRSSSDKYKTSGDDTVRAEELYIKIQKDIVDNVEAMIKLDGADIANGKQKDTHKYVDEAIVTFNKIGGVPLKVVFGKTEMPFGQDYEKFLLASATHKFEVKRVWGLLAAYKVDGFGSIEAGTFERDPFYNLSSQSYDKPETSMTDSYAVKLKVNDLVENLSVEVSTAKIGKDKADPAEEDESRTSVAAKYKINNLGIHMEYTTFDDKGHVLDDELIVMQLGVDYKLEKWLLKARYETSDNDVDDDDSEETRSAIGVSYYISPKAFITFEKETVTFDGTKDDEDELLAGIKFKF